MKFSGHTNRGGVQMRIQDVNANIWNWPADGNQFPGSSIRFAFINRAPNCSLRGTVLIEQIRLRQQFMIPLNNFFGAGLTLQ